MRPYSQAKRRSTACRSQKQPYLVSTQKFIQSFEIHSYYVRNFSLCISNMNERKEHLVADFAKIKPTPVLADNPKERSSRWKSGCLHAVVEISKDNVLTTTRKRPRFTMSWREKGIWKSRRTKSRSSPGFPSSSHLTTCTGPWGTQNFNVPVPAFDPADEWFWIEVRSTGSSRRTCPESWWSGSTGFRSGRSRPTWKWEEMPFSHHPRLDQKHRKRWEYVPKSSRNGLLFSWSSLGVPSPNTSKSCQGPKSKGAMQWASQGQL